MKDWKSPYSGKVYKLRELTFGVSSRIEDKALTFDQKTGLPKQDTWIRRREIVKAGLVKPKLTDEQIENLPEVEGIALVNAIKGINLVPLGNLPVQSSDTERTISQENESTE